jgi:zona occludens toxin
MITLITGAPGSGKTLYTVDKLLRDLIGTTVDVTDDDGAKQKVQRKIYSNINGLLLDHELVDKEWLDKLHENKTTGAVVVFDEVQRVWPNRPAGSRKPPSVEYLETHRHDGVDLIIMTQNPQLLDPAVRALVGRHLHLRRVGSFGAAMIYEWDACSNSLNFKAAFARTGYRYSKRAQQLYVSSRAHTKQKRALPTAIYMLGAGLIGAFFMWPTVIDRITSKGDIVPEAAAVQQAQTVMAQGPRSSKGPAAPMTFMELMAEQQVYQSQFIPRDRAFPHTAPRYDQLTQPVVVPYAAMCVARASECRCYTEQVTRIDVPDEVCRDHVEKGIFYDQQMGPQAPNGGTVYPDGVQPGKTAPAPVSSPRPVAPMAEAVHDGQMLAWMKTL